jgi:lipoprotein NlpD
VKDAIHTWGIFAAGLLVSVALGIGGCASTKPAPVTDRTGAAPKPPVAPREAPSGTYTVKRGDTLYSIAANHGQDYRDIAAWNNIVDPAKLEVGQQLRVAPPEGSQTAVTKPIAGPSVVETRPLGAQSTAAGANTEAFKREPKGGKQPYSEQAWAQLKKADERSRAPQEVAAIAPSTPAGPRPDAKPGEPISGEEGIEWSWPASGKVIGAFNESTSKGLGISGKLGDPVLAAANGKVVYAGSGLRGYGKLVIIKHNTAFLSAYAHNSQILVKEGQSVSRGQRIAELGNTDSEGGQAKLHFEIRRQGRPVDPTKYLPTR